MPWVITLSGQDITTEFIRLVLAATDRPSLSQCHSETWLYQNWKSVMYQVTTINIQKQEAQANSMGKTSCCPSMRRCDLDLQYPPYKSYMPVTSALGFRDRRIVVACWSASLDKNHEPWVQGETLSQEILPLVSIHRVRKQANQPPNLDQFVPYPHLSSLRAGRPSSQWKLRFFMGLLEKSDLSQQSGD